MGVMTGPPRSKPRCLCFLGSLHIARGGGGWEHACYPGPQVRVCGGEGRRRGHLWEAGWGSTCRTHPIPVPSRRPLPLPERNVIHGTFTEGLPPWGFVVGERD